MNAIRAFATAVALGLMLPAAGPASADFDAPKKKIDCKKPENKSKPACKPKRGEATDDEVYHAAYWMAREGRYAEALTVLKAARNGEDPRILTATGFATRKLGDVDAALPFYHRALAQNPDLVMTRAYLGEAYLSRGDVAAAEGQLQDIAQRCGTVCEAYQSLADHIATYKANTSRRG